jgi:hypothetical protein
LLQRPVDFDLSKDISFMLDYPVDLSKGQYSDQQDALFVSSLLGTNSLYMIRALLAHHQEALHTQKFIYFVYVVQIVLETCSGC